MTESNGPLNFETMTVEQFQLRLPELFSAAGSGRVSEDPRFTSFLEKNPTCAALVRDLEYIAETARQLIDVTVEEPSDNVWSNIQNKLKNSGQTEESV